MKELWKREWASWKRDVYKWMGINAGIMLAVFLLYIIRKQWLFKVADGVKSLPDALQAFFAMRPDIVSGNLLFFLKYMLLFINVSLAWNFCCKAMRRIWIEEENSSIYSMCSQWYSRRQIAATKCAFPLFLLFSGYGIFTFYNIALTMICGSTWQQRWIDAGSLLGLWVRAVPAIGLMMSICACRALYGKITDVSSWTGWLIFGTMILGNLYKIRDALRWVLEYTGHDGTGIQKWLGWLDALYWVSPLSWANPYTEASAGKIMLQILLCIALGAGFFVLGIRGYEKRDL